jgi:hypothetical protein
MRIQHKDPEFNSEPTYENSVALPFKSISPPCRALPPTPNIGDAPRPSGLNVEAPVLVCPTKRRCTTPVTVGSDDSGTAFVIAYAFTAPESAWMDCCRINALTEAVKFVSKVFVVPSSIAGCPLFETMNWPITDEIMLDWRRILFNCTDGTIPDVRPFCRSAVRAA